MSPPNDEGPACQPTPQDETQNNIAIVAQRDAADKRLRSLQAAYVLAGHELLRTEGGELYAARWGHARRLPTLDAAEDFLRRVGGNHG